MIYSGYISNFINNSVFSDKSSFKYIILFLEQQDFLEPRAPQQPLQGEPAAVAGPAVGLPGAAGQPPAPARQPGPGPNNPQDNAGIWFKIEQIIMVLFDCSLTLI